MRKLAVDPTMLRAWLSARSVARGLSMPVLDHGGFRVDTNSPTEVRRWVFPQVTAGLVELGRTIDVTRHLLKLCGTADELRTALPPGWQLHSAAYFMTTTQAWAERPLPAGHTLEVIRKDAVIEVLAKSSAGDLAASGYAAETQQAFIYDRIMTAPEHRRRGLGRALMTALSQARENTNTPQLLVATENGRALYLALGWQTVSPYSTASLVDVT